MNFEEFRTQLEKQLGAMVKFELQEFVYRPYSHGGGRLGYRINDICYRLTFDGRENHLRVDSSEAHEKYLGAAWVEVKHFNGLAASVKPIATLIGK